MNDDGQHPGDDLDRSAAAAAHALDATDGAEAAAVETVAAATPEARAELDSFRETAGLLGLATEPVDPPARLRDDLLAKIALTAQVAPEPSAAQVQATARTPSVAQDQAAAQDSGLAQLGLVDSVPLSPTDPALVTEAPAGSADTPAERTARRRWFQRPGAVLAGAAAAAALLLGGGFAGSAISSSLNDTSSVTASAESLAAITSAPDSRSARSSIEDGSTATVVWSAALGRSAVLVDGLSALPSDRTYEAWYISSDQVTAAGTFEAGDTTTWHVLDGSMGSGDAIAVTVEPAGGSDQPTTVPILVVESA